ncbi:hypothetical protein [Pseudomonas siliginis]|uniref:Uncharacterized protein n=1 Tax=Pseudomonas siliginis TaxID=2842346 RepID=A0ABY5CGM6_9PSED|nr:hypothetical protein [Pseudomonas siliginis]UST85811.1 hypothetical protein NF677_03790 [Pseudomonas siliginis]
MKKMNMALAALTILSSSAFAEPAKQFMVPGSDKHDFGIECRLDNKITFYVDKNHPNNKYRVARNIYFTEVSSGKVAISYLHGFINADEEATYLSAPDERCETFRI